MYKPGDRLKLRPEVEAFAQIMEAVLRTNDHKGGWKLLTPLECMSRLGDEVDELHSEIKEGGHPFWTEERQLAKICHEAADVANYAMFTADCAGALELFVKALQESAKAEGRE